MPIMLLILRVGAPITASGGNWLCATKSASLTLTVSVGAGCGIGTGALSPNTTYQAVFPFFVDGSSQRMLNVTLTVGGASTGGG